MSDFTTSFLTEYTFEKGVYCNTNVDVSFEDIYLAVRQKENRIYEDDIVATFPFVAASHSQYVEWNMRQKSLHRFLRHLKAKKPKYVLDLGCGNGWFLHHIAAAFPESICIGMDINKLELQQAARIFKADNLFWLYEDIFACKLGDFLQFDCVILNGCLQYFEKPENLINTLQSKQTKTGEIHILDSPLYKNALAAKAAKARSFAYFQHLDASASAQYFYHHTWEILNYYKWRILYRPTLYQRLVNKLLNPTYNPFCWVCISQ